MLQRARAVYSPVRVDFQALPHQIAQSFIPLENRIRRSHIFNILPVLQVPVQLPLFNAAIPE
jgi:hypothetical protein